MSDERGKKRDTPTGIGPVRPSPAHAPRGAGLSGNPPAAARPKATQTGMAPVTIQHDPRADPKRNYEPIPNGPWDATTTPPRTPVPEPGFTYPAAEPSAPPSAYHPPDRSPPPRARSPDPVARAAADAFAATRPADIAAAMRAHERAAVPREHHERPVPAREAYERGGANRPERERASPHRPGDAGPSMRPGASPRPPEPQKSSLRLKLDVDAHDAVEDGRVRVPKRRAPMLLGILLLLGLIAGSGLWWVESHGGMDNLVDQLERVARGEPAQPVVAPQPTAAAPAAEAEPTTASPQTARASTQQPAEAPPPSAAANPTPPSAYDPATGATAEPQVATGELEVPGEASSAVRPTTEATQPPTATAEPPARPAPAKRARTVKRTPVKREPVIRIEQLGEDALGAAPPDPSGQELLPPPDPPAPE